MSKFKKAFFGLIIFALINLCMTASTYAQTYKGQKLDFEGSGSLWDPYLIESVDDLCLMRDKVNEGQSFAGVFFKQTADIDLTGIDWEPIGLFNSGSYFYGIYNGAGHSISNLVIDSADNAGLFGVLGGIIMNLGIESGKVKGDCVGSIASHSIGNGAMILNCYNKAEISGNRAGGIADNFNGMIIDCWNVGNLKGTLIGGITSYNSLLLLDNTSYGYPINNDNFFGDIINNHTADLSEYDFNTLYQSFISKSDEHLSSLNQIVDDKFGGSGKEEDPYLINTVDDLIFFRDLVNAGFSFIGCWFQQTKDIDLQSVDNWTPIGVFDGPNYFYGVYDGAGHTIQNLDIDRTDNAGFFGRLAGTVMNLGIESGSIKGVCVGGIASHSLPGYAMILNCYNKADIYGTIRAGGIADNFLDGYIINCWNSGTVESDGMEAGICSYAANWVNNCYSIGNNIVDREFEGYVENSENYQLDSVNYNLLTENLNSNLNKMADITNYQHSNFNLWTFNKNNAVYGEKQNYLKYFILREMIIGIPLIAILFLVNMIILAHAEYQRLLSPKEYRSFLVDQWNKLISNKSNIIKVMVIGIFELCIAMIMIGLINGDRNIILAFGFTDTADAFMDYFNPMFTMVGTHLNADNYYDNTGAYPPVARTILWLCGKVIPQNVILRGGGKIIREYSFGLVSFFIVYFISLMLLAYSIYKLGDGNKSYRKIFTVFMLFSSPMIFLIDRGNILVFSLIFTLVFIHWYDSPSRIKRDIAYIFLGLAAAIKIYPAIFGILLLRQKKWKEAIRCAIYGIILFIGPFLFIGGWPTLIQYFNNLTSSTEIKVVTNDIYHNYSGAMRLLFDRLFDQAELGAVIGSTTKIPVVILLLAGSFFSKEKWKALLCMTLILIFVPENYGYYMLTFCIIPLTCFYFTDHSKRIDYIYAILLCSILVPLQFLNGAFQFKQSDTMYSFIFACELIIIIIIAVDTLFQYLKPENNNFNGKNKSLDRQYK